ncbi:DinB family protein [Euzebyella marina]|uniref:DinB family protein n=1 Tax=Euzebyella marina TaxID=1761453 RepID=A0A3G2L6Z8_9FLAO|nr:DinB family protein [Euzebyella marina]AYN68006.1 DinB family protein [Euzebyella marina]
MKTTDLQFTKPFPFYKNYIDLVKDVELMDMLQRQSQNFPEFMATIPQSKLDFRYAENKWTMAEVLLHIIDSERIFQYRALRFSRGDQTPLPGFEQDDYVPFSKANNRTLQSLIDEYSIVRNSTLHLFNQFDTNDLERKGIASSLDWSVGALGFVICGHQKHHRNILRERYL